jgi:hypothetical protein
MKFLTMRTDFEAQKRAIDRLVDVEKRFPGFVFRDRFSNFVCMDFDKVLTGAFHERLKNFLERMGETRYFLAVIDPEPENYFFHHFGKYPFLEVSVLDSEAEFLRAVNEDPGGSPADAITYNGRVVVAYSDSGEWALYGERDYEFGIVAFSEEEHKEAFISSYGQECVFTIEGAIEHLLVPSFANSSTGVPDDIRNELLSNYH